MRLTAAGTLLAALALTGCNQRISREESSLVDSALADGEVSESVYTGPINYTYLLTFKDGVTENDVRKGLSPFEVYQRDDNKFEVVPKEGVTLEDALKEIPKLHGLEVLDIRTHVEPVVTETAIVRSQKDILLDEMMEAWVKDDMKKVDEIGNQIREIELDEKEAEIDRMIKSGELKF